MTRPPCAHQRPNPRREAVMASASDFNRYRTSGAEYVRNTLTTLHQHGTGVGARILAVLLAFPGAVQGAYYVLTGLWPQVNISSFLAVTGPKSDVWLVHTVGWLVFVIGVALCVAAYRRQRTVEVLIVGIGSALALAIVDVYYVVERQISAVYLLDAAVELGIVFVWICSAYSDLGEANRAPAAHTAAPSPSVPLTPPAPVPATPAAPA